MDKIERRKLKSLVLDPNIYPREKINEHNVGRLRTALKAGISLPPILVEKDTNRVWDGFHRVRAYQEENDANHSVNVICRKFKSDYEMFLAAAEVNAKQGLPLGETDKAVVLEKVTRIFGGSLEMGAKVLGVTLERAEALAGRIVAVVPEKGFEGELERDWSALKPNLTHLKERQNGAISFQQHKVNSSCLGVPVRRLVNDIRRHIEKGTLDTTNQPLMYDLRELGKLIVSQEWFNVENTN